MYLQFCVNKIAKKPLNLNGLDWMTPIVFLFCMKQCIPHIMISIFLTFFYQYLHESSENPDILTPKGWFM